METINKNYHFDLINKEKQTHLNKFRNGKDIILGKSYDAIVSRSGRKHEGPFIALTYDNGNLLVGKPNYRSFAIIHEDVVDDHNSIYTESLPLLIVFRRDISDIVGNDSSDRVQYQELRRACSVKWMCPLSEIGAAMILRWYQSEIEYERTHHAD